MALHKHELEYAYVGTAETDDYDKDCVARVLKEKADAGKTIDDQAKAIAISECRYNRKANLFNLQQPELIDNKYAKYWLLQSDVINKNGWSVGSQYFDDNIKTAIGMPFVITARSWFSDSDYGTDEYTHPEPRRSKDPLVAGEWHDPQNFITYQNRYNVGPIAEINKEKGGYYGMIKIAEQFRGKRLPPFCSPAILPMMGEPMIGSTHWRFLHLAGLMEKPAYGVYMAALRGSCIGTAHQCSMQLRSAQTIEFKCPMGKLAMTEMELARARLRLQ